MNKVLPRLLAFWVIWCAFCAVAGWGLSAAGMLRPVPYTLLVLVLLTGFARVAGKPFFAPPRRWFASFRRRSFLPWAYALVLGMALAGGILYAPSNYDALSYRLPRIFHWLAEGRWHWIETMYQAVNTRTAANEWVLLPLVMWTRSDRLLFLASFISFLLMPGLVFSVLRRLGIRGRVAWNWMWIFPSGYCFALQAGSIGNDLFGAVLFLAAVHYALRARQSQAWGDLALSVLAMALTTGVKFSNMTLALPWLAVIWPSVPISRRYPARTAALALAAILASFLPTAVLNHWHCGDWKGLKAEPVSIGTGSPAIYLAWNVPYLVVQNFSPPIFPPSKHYAALVDRLIPDEWEETLARQFEGAAAGLRIGDLMAEESGPLGLGIMVLLVGGVIFSLASLPRGKLTVPPGSGLRWLLMGLTVLALVPFLLNSGLSGSGRYVAPFYILLVAPFLGLRGLDVFVRTRIWQGLAAGNFALLILVMVLSPARPLWPVEAGVSWFNERAGVPRGLVGRAKDVYETYLQRPRVFGPLARFLPSDGSPVGLLSANTPEASLWLPLGSRRIVHVLCDDDAERLRGKGLRYVVAGERSMAESGFPALDIWLSHAGGKIVGTEHLRILNRYGDEPWHVIELE